jgi:ribosomal-protein-alanine N-acetyltransferase
LADQEEDEIAILKMSMEHLDEVIAIENQCFSTPWSPAIFRREILDPGPSVNVVAVSGQRVIGYLIAWVVADEFHIANIAVHPGTRRKGIARMLMKHVLETAGRMGARIAALEVRASNEQAKSLYRGFGFREVAIRKCYYPDDGEDAVVMILPLLDHPEAGDLGAV